MNCCDDCMVPSPVIEQHTMLFNCRWAETAMNASVKYSTIESCTERSIQQQAKQLESTRIYVPFHQLSSCLALSITDSHYTMPIQKDNTPKSFRFHDQKMIWTETSVFSDQGGHMHIVQHTDNTAEKRDRQTSGHGEDIQLTREDKQTDKLKSGAHNTNGMITKHQGHPPNDHGSEGENAALYTSLHAAMQSLTCIHYSSAHS